MYCLIPLLVETDVSFRVDARSESALTFCRIGGSPFVLMEVINCWCNESIYLIASWRIRAYLNQDTFHIVCKHDIYIYIQWEKCKLKIMVVIFIPLMHIFVLIKMEWLNEVFYTPNFSQISDIFAKHVFRHWFEGTEVFDVNTKMIGCGTNDKDYTPREILWKELTLKSFYHVLTQW